MHFSYTSQIMIPYKPFARHLAENHVIASPAELHGHVCGMLVVNPQLSASDWVDIIIEDYCFDISDKSSLTTVLSSLYEFAGEKLAADNFSFYPLLPDDESELSYRLEELSSWCSSFLSGMAIAGLKSDSNLDEDGHEFIKDMEKISRVETDLDGSQGEEADYFELVEYIKAGALLLMAELSKVQSDDPPSDSQH